VTSALVIGGTGPTGPHVVRGLVERGLDVTILHSGRHELAEVDDVPHLHGDAFSTDALLAVLGDRSFDVVVAMYGRLRSVAEVMVGRTGQLVTVGGVPAYRGYFDAGRWEPAGLPVPTAEHAPKADEGDDGKSYRIARTEAILFELHPEATHFRYPYVYGPRQPTPREWLFVRRILDGRPHMVIPDDGLTLVSHGYVENLAHALLLAVDRPDAAAGRAFNAADEECLTIRQVGELIAAELGRPLELVSMPSSIAPVTRPLLQAASPTHRVMDLADLRHRLGYRDRVPARRAVPLAARWLADHPPEPGGMEERVLEDPFDYDAEDRLIEWWRTVTASAPTPAWAGAEPGYGLAYGGPGSTYVRADTRI
jgi:nucleoside-diphosphate-sugar epimerase